MPYSDIAYFNRRYLEIKPNNCNESKSTFIIEKETVDISTPEGGIESIKSSEILKLALFEFKIAYYRKLDAFKSQIPYVLNVLNTRKRQVNQRNSIYFFDYSKNMYRDSLDFTLDDPISTFRSFTEMKKTSPDYLELNLNQIISKIIKNELESDPKTYFFLHNFGKELSIDSAYSLLPLNNEYISLKDQITKLNIPYLQRENINAAISNEEELLKNKRGSYKGFFGAEGKYSSDVVNGRQIGKTLYSIFRKGEKIAEKDLEDTLEIASTLTEAFFIHQFGMVIDFDLFKSLSIQVIERNNKNKKTYKTEDEENDDEKDNNEKDN